MTSAESLAQTITDLQSWRAVADSALLTELAAEAATAVIIEVHDRGVRAGAPVPDGERGVRLVWCTGASSVVVEVSDVGDLFFEQIGDVVRSQEVRTAAAAADLVVGALVPTPEDGDKAREILARTRAMVAAEASELHAVVDGKAGTIYDEPRKRLAWIERFIEVLTSADSET